MNYYIAQKQSYYGPEYKFGWVQDETMTHRFWGFEAALIFDSAEEAQKWVEKADAKIYHLEHNEYSRPEYLILNENDAYRLAARWMHEDLGDSIYSWEHCEDPEKPTEDEVFEAMIAATSKSWEVIKAA